MQSKASDTTPDKQLNVSVQPRDGLFILCANDKPMQTPGKHEVAIPSKPLADAICWEWQTNSRFNSSRMPLTSLAYTAIDRIAGQQEAIIEALLVYVDTDTLSYRDSGDNQLLLDRQIKRWDPILQWAGELLGVPFVTTTGIMPIDQPPELIDAFRKNLETLDVMRLSAASVLASCCSSMVLGLAVVHGHIDGEEAFVLSRLEEDTQAEVWGADRDAGERAERVKNEILAASRFLRLLERQ